LQFEDERAEVIKIPTIAAALGALAIAAAAANAITEYGAPGDGPYDVAVDGAGRVYFTEMAAARIGRFDPRSQTLAEFRVPTAGSGPRGIVVAPDGTVIFTETTANKIGWFDPQRSAFHEYPTGNALAPNTPVLVGDGVVYFTAPGSDAIGRLDLASGAVATFAVPTPNAAPYGIKLGPDRALYFTEPGANKIGRFDLESHLISEFATLAAASAPHRLWIWNHYAYFTEFGAGMLGRFDIRRHTFREWPSPGGRASKPDGIAIDRNGQVWCAESAGVSGLSIVHFDPARETFATAIPIRSRGAVVGDMALAPGGSIWMALGGAHRIAVLSP
jgi:virginiamycin B lyase